jgi:hypothetical protein
VLRQKRAARYKDPKKSLIKEMNLGYTGPMFSKYFGICSLFIAISISCQGGSELRNLPGICDESLVVARVFATFRDAIEGAASVSRRDTLVKFLGNSGGFALLSESVQAEGTKIEFSPKMESARYQLLLRFYRSVLSSLDLEKRDGDAKGDNDNKPATPREKIVKAYQNDPASLLELLPTWLWERTNNGIVAAGEPQPSESIFKYITRVTDKAVDLYKNEKDSAGGPLDPFDFVDELLNALISSDNHVLEFLIAELFIDQRPLFTILAERFEKEEERRTFAEAAATSQIIQNLTRERDNLKTELSNDAFRYSTQLASYQSDIRQLRASRSRAWKLAALGTGAATIALTVAITEWIVHHFH